MRYSHYLLFVYVYEDDPFPINVNIWHALNQCLSCYTRSLQHGLIVGLLLFVTISRDTCLSVFLHLPPPGVVHLDLKPQNFVLVKGRMKLIDLGISQRLPDEATRVNLSLNMGTLTYMSPEQLEGPLSQQHPPDQQPLRSPPCVGNVNHFKVPYFPTLPCVCGHLTICTSVINPRGSIMT